MGETLARDEVWRRSRKWRKGEQGVFWDVADIAKIFKKGGRYQADLLGDLLVG